MDIHAYLIFGSSYLLSKVVFGGCELKQVSRPALFKKSIKKFNVAWWAYSFPLTVLALAATEYAQEVSGGVAHAMMLVLSALSVLVSFLLMVFTALNTNILFTGKDDPALSDLKECSTTLPSSKSSPLQASNP